ncbi:MAG: hypothetical protein QOG85_227 [Gaiellaceae bacterium]|jgi:hypothetical protein|nr:hypothetical protein [Gaiellaceae bacterium]
MEPRDDEHESDPLEGDLWPGEAKLEDDAEDEDGDDDGDDS